MIKFCLNCNIYSLDFQKPPGRGFLVNKNVTAHDLKYCDYRRDRVRTWRWMRIWLGIRSWAWVWQRACHVRPFAAKLLGGLKLFNRRL